MSDDKPVIEKEIEKTATKTEKAATKTEKEDELKDGQKGQLEDDDDDDDDEEDDDDEDQFEIDIETEIEHQTPEVIAKELLITYLETNPLAYPDALPNETRYQAVGRAIGEMYSALLMEIRKTAG